MLALLKLIPVRAWAYLALSIGMFVGYAYWHHHVYQQGVDSQKDRIMALNEKYDELFGENEKLSAALNDVNAQAAAERAAADVFKHEAAKMIQQLGQEAVQAEGALADARQKLADAAHSPSCATTASLKLCSAMRNY